MRKCQTEAACSHGQGMRRRAPSTLLWKFTAAKTGSQQLRPVWRRSEMLLQPAAVERAALVTSAEDRQL